jgi:hypothetical protein
MANDDLQLALGNARYMQNFTALIYECQAAEHASLDALDGRPPSAKAKEYAATARRHRKSAWQLRRQANMRTRPTPAAPLLPSARTSARAGETGRPPAAKRAAGIRSGTDPGEDDPHEPSPARACLGCGRDISRRRADAKTCGPACRQRLKRQGPDTIAEPRPSPDDAPGWHDRALADVLHWAMDGEPLTSPQERAQHERTAFGALAVAA